MPGDTSDAEPLDFTGHDLFADPSAVWACKRPVVVRVEFAVADGALETLEGRVAYRAGDALLAGTRGERWPVAAARFREDYEPATDEAVGAASGDADADDAAVRDAAAAAAAAAADEAAAHDAAEAAHAASPPRARLHRYTKKRRLVRARRMATEFVVRVGVAGDLLHGGPGDWLVQYREREYGVVCAGLFDETYSIVEGRRA